MRPDVPREVTQFLRGRLRVIQPARGYRFTIDSVVLAGFAWLLPGESVLDLGAGSGILLLLLGYFHHPGRLAGVEIQPELASMAKENLCANGWDDRAEIIEGDLRPEGSVPNGQFDLVISNPPYFEASRGMACQDEGRNMARHSSTCTLEDICAAASRALKLGGRFCFIVPAARLGEASRALADNGLAPRILRMVHSAPRSAPYLALVQARHSPVQGCMELPPLFLRNEDGAYAPEVEALLEGNLGSAPRFLADSMLGKLCRYLRLLGADCDYARAAEDEWLLAEASRGGRILLTRDCQLIKRAERHGGQAFDPGCDEAALQLREVIRRFGAPDEKCRPRCIRCNAVPLDVAPSVARPFVPRYTGLTHESFHVCPCCGKLTWEGSHLERFKLMLTAGQRRAAAAH
jgi:tRNA1Val (adenine37-N6)-methyltransferase